ncbi:hypothetical protein BST27_25495 [Mycobacterium intermedium]|uniref:PPIase cyclophilin-type domain-containing protein n=1 Tax=Mycobacterium intermedium TaxID=28445 RepID=A0A1E3S5M3_MYCIE|nr:peptidylprolyl isomerase [Mycobacterium intermedium]MCV6966393.1 peptidylprolyl isomerase [Mycobacterium intermedium]ODQ97400.1 hypothetical protein BHQ20_26710 [Mycobacterium intermedium]OPE46311.1 hypothetical protein BV508_26470 [Mycobacterium intermedium]ORA96475.1 hypothetical protein BST27_25495 [Mycobacterium intermedium]
MPEVSPPASGPPPNTPQPSAPQPSAEQPHPPAPQRKRTLLLTALGSVAVLAIAAGIFAVLVLPNTKNDTTSSPGSSDVSETDAPADHTSAASATPSVPPLPAFAAPANLGANCQYPAAAEPAAKPAKPPQSGKVPTDPPQIPATLSTDHGDIGLQLANNESPCTVNSFVSLAQQGFFDNTYCHRLTVTATLGVLQCGDPRSDGTGGPGYEFANEYPTDQYQADDPALSQPVLYPRGTLAMANAGPNTNGSQFFLVYNDSELPPEYPVFGTIDEAGLEIIHAIAQAGVVDGAEDGQPPAPSRSSRCGYVNWDARGQSAVCPSLPEQTRKSGTGGHPPRNMPESQVFYLNCARHMRRNPPLG